MKRILSAVSAVVLFASCINEASLVVDTPMPDDSSASTDIEGHAYVKFSEEMAMIVEEDMTDGDLVTRSAGLNHSLEALGIISMKRVFSDGGEYEMRRRAAGLHLWYEVSYTPTLPHTKAAESLLAIEGVDVVEPVRKISIGSVGFNDWNSDLWGLYNVDNPGYDINVAPVWENYTVGNPDVVVAIVDSGVDFRHPDLAANCTSQHHNFVSTGVIVPESHGTHVAGTIAAVSNNGIGVCGIAGGDAAAKKPGVRITSYQIFQNDVQGNSAEAIAKAADDGAVICQNSWGYTYDKNGDGKIDKNEMDLAMESTVSGPDKKAIDYFIANAGCDQNGNQRPDSPMKGGLVVFAAGNEAISNCAPANYEPVIAVGAIDKNGRRADFSNYGDWVDIAAPGVGILSTVPGSAYESMQGTSMACPHVSGVAALVLSYCGGPGFTAEMLKEKILKGSNKTRIPASDKIGGLLDAYGAITYGDGIVPDNVDDLDASGRANNIDLTWTQVGDSKGLPVYAALVIYGKDKSAVENATPQSYSGCSTFTHEIGVAVGEVAECSISGLDFSTTYYCKLYNYTYGMVYSDPTEVLTVDTGENNAPVVEFQTDGEISVYAHENFTLGFTVVEPDDHTYTLSYAPGSEADVLKKLPGGRYAVEITGKAAPEGSYVGKLTVTDEFDLSTTYDVKYTIRSNKAPVVLKEIEDVFLRSRGDEIRIPMADYVSDPDGEQLKYDIQVSDEQVLFFKANNNVLYGTPLKYGKAEVVVIASDARGESVRFEFNVLIKNPAEPVSLYPNPVTDYLNVGTLDMAETTVRITNSTGKLMYSETSQVSGIEPARVDMTSFEPGVYAVSVVFGGKEYVQTVVKL